MEKVGYVILISMYLLVIPMADGLSNIFENDLKTINSKPDMTEKLSNSLIKSMGMDSFIKNLSKGI